MATLLQKYGGRADRTWAKHANDQTDYGRFQDLPPDIRNGVAQLNECQLGVFQTGDHAGEPFFQAAGLVILPEFHTYTVLEGWPPKRSAPRTERTRNKTTRLRPEPLCDTPNRKDRQTFEDHLAWVMNVFRMLGIPTKGTTFRDLPKLCQLALMGKIHFKFSTRASKPSQQYPTPSVFQEWEGKTTLDQAVVGAGITGAGMANGSPVTGDGLRDDTGYQEGEGEQGGEGAPAQEFDETAGGNGLPQDEGEASGDGDTVAAQGDEEAPSDIDPATLSLAELGENAQQGDAGCQNRLIELAEEAGMSPEEIHSTDEDWTTLAATVATLQEQAAEGGDEAEESEEETIPQKKEPTKGSMWRHRPAGKDGKPAKRPVDVEVTIVDKVRRTVMCKDVADGKLYRGVSWDALEPV